MSVTIVNCRTDPFIVNCRTDPFTFTFKAAVRQALESRTLVPGKRPYSYGEQNHAELCRWVGINPSALAVPLERLSA
jgi:hypothetical protein